MRTRRRASCQGFTLAELLVAGVMAAVVSGAAWTLLVVGQQMWATGDITVQTTDQARLGLERLTSDLRQGSIASLNLAGLPAENVALQVAPGTTVGTTVGSLSFTAPSSTGGPPSTVTYAFIAQTNGQMALVRKQPGLADQTVTQHITNFVFQRPSGAPLGRTSLLRLSMTTVEQARLFGGGVRPITTRLDAQVSIRNP